MHLSVIILCYKSKTDLERLLPSILGSLGIGFDSSGISARYIGEIIIVDNGSEDGIANWLKQKIEFDKTRGRAFYQMVKFIQNSNTGFASGNNIGIRQATGKYILLLNPDMELQPDTLQNMLDFMEARPDVGISGCKLIKADGKLDLACRRRFPNPRNSFLRLSKISNRDYNYSDIDENKSMEVDSVVGAFLLIKKSVIDKIGLLDESFFMYGEDLDWCWRCKELGFKVWYYPKAVAIHFKGESSKKAPFKMLEVFHDSMWIFYRKHYQTKYPFILNWLVWLGIKLRLSALIFINLFKSKPVVSK